VLESSDGVVEQSGIGQSLDGAEPKAIAARTATPAPIEVTEEDCVVRRLRGLLSPIQGTVGDALLRNLGCRVLIVTGVSADVEIPDAVNRGGCTAVAPSDAIAGVPSDCTPAMIRPTLRLVATVVTTFEVLGCFKRPRRTGVTPG
jgi:hypothetical protein